MNDVGVRNKVEPLTLCRDGWGEGNSRDNILYREG